jgi:hypothetical protein
VLEFLGPVHRVHRHHHRIGPQDAPVRHQQLRAVRWHPDRRTGPRRQDPRRHQGPRPGRLRRQHRPGRLLRPPIQPATGPGLDVDVCKALAAATLGDADKVKYVPLNAQQRFTALQSGEVDVLSRNTTFTLTRDASLGLHFTGVTYYDGQGFMVPVKTKMKSAKQLKGQTVCVQSGTTTEKNLTDYSKANGLNIKPVVFEKLEAAENAYFSGRCIAYTTDASGLASTRSKEAKDPGRTHDPARADLQGTAGPDGAPR